MTTVLDRHQNRPITAHSTKILLIKYSFQPYGICTVTALKFSFHDHDVINQKNIMILCNKS